MNTLFGRFRGRSASPLESELRAARPEPPAQLVQKIVGTLEPRQTRRASAGLRLAWASALTVALVAALAATGGLVYAASAVVHATRATHVFQSAPTGPPAAALSSSCSQYGAVPTITGVSPSAAFWGQTVTIQGGNFAAQSPVTSVRFSPGVAASFQILSGLRIRAIVPGGSSTGRITVSNCKGSSTSGIFTVYRQRICTVPHLIGMTIADAKDAIVDAHCAVGDIDKVTVGAPPHIYYVIKQSPSPGIQLLPLGLVNFTARG